MFFCLSFRIYTAYLCIQFERVQETCISIRETNMWFISCGLSLSYYPNCIHSSLENWHRLASKGLFGFRTNHSRRRRIEFSMIWTWCVHRACFLKKRKYTPTYCTNQRAYTCGRKDSLETSFCILDSWLRETYHRDWILGSPYSNSAASTVSSLKSVAVRSTLLRREAFGTSEGTSAEMYWKGGIPTVVRSMWNFIRV